MLINRENLTECPNCGSAVGLTKAMVLQAMRLGVSVYCNHCGHEWDFRLSSDEAGTNFLPKEPKSDANLPPSSSGDGNSLQ